MSMNYFGDIMTDYTLFFTHCDYCLEKWKILNTIYDGANYETCALLEYW